MLNRLASNMGFNSFRAMAGAFFGGGTLRSAWEAFGMAGREMQKFGGYMTQRTGAVPIGGKATTTAAARRGMAQGRGFLKDWAVGRDLGPGFTRMQQRGIGAARVGGAAAGGAGVADFMNPWGFGWGD